MTDRKRDEFRDREYLPPQGEVIHWRRLFLREIENRAGEVIQRLADLMPAWQEFVNNQDKDQVIWDMVDLMQRYGLHRNREGKCDEWVSTVLLKTLIYWSREKPEAIGVRFAPLEITCPLIPEQIFMASLGNLAADVYQTDDGEINVIEYPVRVALTKADWVALTEDMMRCDKDLADNNAEYLIMPPLGSPAWLPFGQTKMAYLEIAQMIIRKSLADIHWASELSPKVYSAIIEDRMKRTRDYCQRLEKYYKEVLGYKKLPYKPTALRQIAWTVQAHVLNKKYEEVIDINNNPESITAQGVRARVLDVLGILDLSPRANRKADRKAINQPQF